MKYLRKRIPFSNLSDDHFNIFMLRKTIISQKFGNRKTKWSTNCPKIWCCSQKQLVYPQEIIYLEISEAPQNFFVHINIASITFDTDELNSFISNLNCKPNIIGISECDLIKDNLPLTIINLPNLYFQFIPAESKKGGTIIQIHKNLSYKLRKGLNIYKPKAIESSFTEFMIDKRQNTIPGCIYKYPNTIVSEFTNDSMLTLKGKLSLEKKRVLMGDSNINLLHSDVDQETSKFMDNIYSISFFLKNQDANSHNDVT